MASHDVAVRQFLRVLKNEVRGDSTLASTERALDKWAIVASYGRFVDTTLEKAWLLLPRNDENRRLRPREEFVDFEIWRAAQPRGGWRELWRRPTYHDYFWDVMDALAWAINDLDPTLSRAPEEASA